MTLKSPVQNDPSVCPLFDVAELVVARTPEKSQALLKGELAQGKLENFKGCNIWLFF